MGYKGIDFEVEEEFGGFIDSIGLLEMIFVINDNNQEGGCSYSLGELPILQRFGTAFTSGTSAQAQLLLYDDMLWEGEIVIP